MDLQVYMVGMRGAVEVDLQVYVGWGGGGQWTSLCMW